MRIRPSCRNILSFLLLILFLHEMHELAHMATARMLCGCWGTRDFLYWKLCEGCDANQNFIIITLAGPLLTYTLMWAGWWLMRTGRNSDQLSWGMLLVFANLPFARLLAAAFRGGDEIMAMRSLFEGTGMFRSFAVIVGFVIVIAATIPPLVLAFKQWKQHNRVIYFLGLLIVPYYFDKLVLEYGLNTIQPKGFFAEPAWWGANWLVVSYQLLLILLLFLLRNYIPTLFIEDKTALR